MYKGLSTLEVFEQCIKRGLCENHSREVNQNGFTVEVDELPRKTFLYVRSNILYTILFKNRTKFEKIRTLLLKTPVFSRIFANGDASEAADEILILDSVIIFTLCHLSKICCIGALFQEHNVTSEDPEIELLQQLLLIDRFEESLLHHLYPQLEKNFIGFDMNLIKVSYVLTLLFVRNYCIKINIKTVIETLEEDFKGRTNWEHFKNVGDCFYEKEKYKEACSAYSAAVMSNSYSPALFIQRAQTYVRLGKFKAAQLDAYISIIINHKWCEGYRIYSSCLLHQKLYQEAFNVANYGLAICEPNGSFYETLQTFRNEIDRKYINKESVNNTSENSIPDSAKKPLPEKKYFPVLVDSDSSDSDSEICQKTVPELVDASDSTFEASDESETVEKKIKLTQTKNKTKKKRIPPEDSSAVVHAEMDMAKIRTYIREASEAIVSDCGYKAVRIFRGPLRDFIDSPKLNTFEECEVVCMKYAYGIAYCKSGGYDDLLKCIIVLKEIIQKHDSVTFPAAYYALGLTFRKLNRFKEALHYLETVQNFLSKGIHFKVYPWPEIPTVIQETKPDILKALVYDLIKECENPPSADAFCRFAECSYQPSIYYSDPDFKGYISLFCSEHCCVQYHLQCWKIIKAEKKLTDKEFLEEVCFTPDCDGVIIKVHNIDKKGDLTKEFASDFKKTGKQKWAKWEKKTDAKEKKKKRANSRSEDGSVEILCENKKVNSRKPVDENGAVTLPVVKDASPENGVMSSPKVKPSELDDNSEKNDIVSSFQEATYYHTSETGKEVSNELQTSYVPHVPKEGNECNSEQETSGTSHFQKKSKIVTEEVQEYSSEYLVSQCIKNNVYSYMCDFLQHHGPLRIDDPLLTNELSSFPDEANAVIAQCGGIGEFLKNDLRFAFVGDIYICVVSDLAKAYRMSTNSSLQSDVTSFQSLKNTDSSELLNECGTITKPQNFGLNPDAVEYTPVISSLKNKNNGRITYEILNHSSSEFITESSELSSDNDNAILASLKNKSESCNTVLDVKLNKSYFISEQTNDNSNKESNEEFFNKQTVQPKPNSEASNLDSVGNSLIHCNFTNSNEDLCIDEEDLFSSNTKKGAQGSYSCLYEDSKYKKLQTEFLPVLKEFCDKNFNSYHKYIDNYIKPYVIRKLPETNNAETEAFFESKGEDTKSTDELKYSINSLTAEKQELVKDNLALRNHLKSASKEIQNLYAEVSELQAKLSSSSLDLEALKKSYKEKEETLKNGREYLVRSLANSHLSIDDLKKKSELLERENQRLQETVDKLTLSLNDAEEIKKNAAKAEEKKHVDIINSLQKENDELKNRLKHSEIQFLKTKKAEFLKRVEDKCHDVYVKKQELTRGLSMISGNLNPVLESSMKAIFAQFSSYEDELKTLKLAFVKSIDAQIEKIENGTPLKELNNISVEKLPDPPHLQSLYPDIDKSLLNSTHMPFSLFNSSCWSQMPSASVISKAASATNIPPASTITPPTNLSASVIKSPAISNVIPTGKPAAAVIPQSTQCTKVIQPPTSAASIVSSIAHSVFASVIPDLEASTKKTYDSLNTKIQEPLRNTGISTSTFIPFTVPTSDKEFNKTCAIFRPPDSVPHNKSESSKVPPGIAKCATNLPSSGTSLNSSKDSLETFPVQEKSFGSVKLVSSVKEPVASTSVQEKKKAPMGKKVGSSYDKLLLKLKEQFPSYSQEELISLVKEFRSQRQGKLTGLPIDAIVSELRIIINSKKAAENKINEQKMQSKMNKVLINKKLVPDPKASAITEQEVNVKKKSAWGNIVSDCNKTFSGSADDDCIICCDPMTARSAYKVPCGHIFHEQCIRQWLKNKSDCPVCRVLLLLPEEYPSLS